MSAKKIVAGIVYYGLIAVVLLIVGGIATIITVEAFKNTIEVLTGLGITVGSLLGAVLLVTAFFWARDVLGKDK